MTIVYAEWWWTCDCGDICDEPYGSEGAAQQAASEHECEADS